MTVRYLLAIICLAMLSLIVGSSSARAQMTMSGGTAHERNVLANIVAHQLSGLVLTKCPVAVRIVPARQMASIAVSDGFTPPPAAKTEDDEIDGLYVDKPATITLASGVDCDDDFRETFVHEYGHHVWVHFLGVADRGYYLRIYYRQLAVRHLVTNYAAVSCEEGFAESFAYYVLQPETLLSRDPGSYRFMEKLAARLRAANSATEGNDLNQTDAR